MRWKDALDALPDTNEVSQLVNAVALPPIGPFVINKHDVVEFEALLVHIQEPHRHSAGPHHQAHELIHSHELCLRKGLTCSRTR